VSIPSGTLLATTTTLTGPLSGYTTYTNPGSVGLVDLITYANLTTNTASRAWALNGRVDVFGAGSGTHGLGIIGVAGAVRTYTNAGTSVLKAVGVQGWIWSAGPGIITHGIALNVRAPQVDSGAAITNAYGLFVNQITQGSSSNYAVYTDGNTPNYFGGRTGIGVVPTAESDGLSTPILKIPEATGKDNALSIGTDTSGALIYDDGAGTVYESKGTSGPYFKSGGDIYARLGDAAGVNEIQLLDSASARRGAWDSDGNFETSGTAKIMGRLTANADLVCSGTIGTPTISAGTPLASATLVGDDMQGEITMTTTSSFSPGPVSLAVISWKTSAPSSNNVILFPANANAGYYPTLFAEDSATTSRLSSSEGLVFTSSTYKWKYHNIKR
jgi:hypothetical protein